MRGLAKAWPRHKRSRYLAVRGRTSKHQREFFRLCPPKHGPGGQKLNGRSEQAVLAAPSGETSRPGEGASLKNDALPTGIVTLLLLGGHKRLPWHTLTAYSRHDDSQATSLDRVLPPLDGGLRWRGPTGSGDRSAARRPVGSSQRRHRGFPVTWRARRRHRPGDSWSGSAPSDWGTHHEPRATPRAQQLPAPRTGRLARTVRRTADEHALGDRRLERATAPDLVAGRAATVPARHGPCAGSPLCRPMGGVTGADLAHW